ncbi:MAG: hypothetical protein WDA02_07935 [Saccharofermentanales bacterium]
MKDQKEWLEQKKKTEISNARKWLSEIYDIKDEIKHWDLVEFLVDVDKFMKYAQEHDGSIAGNEFDDFEDVWYMIKQIEKINNVIEVYISPFWISREKEEIVDFGDVYSNTLFIQINDKLDEEQIDDLLEEIREITQGHEVDVYDKKFSKNGNTYVRVWWD